MDIEELVTVNGRTKFEDLNLLECLEGMEKHVRHNGVILDGLRRVSKLCSQTATHAVILSDKWMKSLFVPNMERYRDDGRVQALSFCIIGTCMRGINWAHEPEGLYQLWNSLADGSLKILDLHKDTLSVQVYGYYFFCAVTMVSNNREIFNTLLENKLLTQIESSLSHFWNQDPWHVLNCLLLLKYLSSEPKLPDHGWDNLSTTITKQSGQDFSWNNLDSLIVEYGRRSQ